MYIDFFSSVLESDGEKEEDDTKAPSRCCEGRSLGAGRQY
jgi:hypothetical protein